MKPGNCDLHIHSNLSDSDLEIESIFKLARAKGLSCIAITDHDTVSGAAQAGIYERKYNLETIRAIELSARHKEAEVHILGYFIDPDNERLRSELSGLKELRRERLLLMADKLNSLGLNIDKDELMQRVERNMPTRLHLALYLIEKRKVKSLREVFRKYLSPGCLAYESRFKHSVKETIQLIKASGGLSFLAHPHMIADQSWIEEFVALGIDGLEIVYPNMSAAKSSVYRNMAEKFNLLRSGGSDAHGSYKKFTVVGCVSIPYEWVEEMKGRL